MPFFVSSYECWGFSFCQDPLWGLALFKSLKDLVRLEFLLLLKLLLLCCPFSNTIASGMLSGELPFIGEGAGEGSLGVVQHNLCSQSPFLMTVVEFDAPIIIWQQLSTACTWESRYSPYNIPYNIISTGSTTSVCCCGKREDYATLTALNLISNHTHYGHLNKFWQVLSSKCGLNLDYGKHSIYLYFSDKGNLISKSGNLEF